MIALGWIIPTGESLLTLKFGHNINSFRNKFEMLWVIVQDKLEILLISETNVDPSFPLSQFVIGFNFDFT